MIRQEEDETLCDFPFYGEKHPFNIGQPLYVQGDGLNCYIAMGFFRSMVGRWKCVAVLENNLTGDEYRIPCEVLTDVRPGSALNYANVVRLSDYRRGV